MKDYEKEIDELYQLVEKSTHADIAPPSTWDESTTTKLVRQVVLRTLTQTVKDDDDLFQHGACDRHVRRFTTSFPC